MTSGGERRLSEIKQELDDIIQSLERVKQDIPFICHGLGEENCVSSLDKQITNLRKAKSSLERLNSNRLAEWVKNAL